MFKMSVADIMCEHIVKVKENVTINKVAHLLLRYRINGVLVVNKNNENELIGILTTTDLFDLLDKVLSNGEKKIDAVNKASNLPVGKVINKDVISLQKNTKLFKAISIINKHHLHTIPVYDEDKLVGVIGRHDILNAAFNMLL